jgi:drug/metabolite transporter (DMT)-like permease
MKPLETIYWLRLALGITAALLCTGYGIATNTIVKENSTYTTLLNGVSIALVIYLISYYIIKSKFSLKVEKPKKLVTMGIGIYFISWITFWTLLYTIIATTIV